MTPAATPGWPPLWDKADHAAARAAFFVTADLLGAPWADAAADRDGDPRAFFERWFRPAPPAAEPGLLTGYYEPEFAAALTPDAHYCHPLHALPPDLTPGPEAPTRAEIVATGCLDAHALAWLADPLDAFLAQVQGSVRLRLPGGAVLRLGYAGKNGHPYRSIGQELVARGAVPAEAIDNAAIRAWARANPQALHGLLDVNPSYVFFRLLDLPPETGPLGNMGRPVTAGVTLAVDPAHIPLGAPVWVETAEFACLCIAQDIGGAIKGPQRGDLYCGTGAAAGDEAGRLRAPVRLTPLLPVGGPA